MKFSLNPKLRKALDEFHNEALSAKLAVIFASHHFRKGDLRNIDPELAEGIKLILDENERMERNEKRANDKASGDD